MKDDIPTHKYLSCFYVMNLLTLLFIRVTNYDIVSTPCFKLVFLSLNIIGITKISKDSNVIQ